MIDVYETNAPTDFPSSKEQFLSAAEPVVEDLKFPDVMNTLDRWKKELLDKIQYLKENLEQANRDKGALFQELDALKAQVSASQQQIQELRKDLSSTLGAFNNMLKEISTALQG